MPADYNPEDEEPHVWPSLPTTLWNHHAMAIASVPNDHLFVFGGQKSPREFSNLVSDGIYANFLGEKDAHAVVTDFQQPPLPRFDYKNSGADAKWINVYTKMDLSHVFGFPLW